MKISPIIVIFVGSLLTLAGQLMLRHAVNQDAIKSKLADGIPSFIFAAALHPLVICAVIIQAFAYMTWLYVLTQEKTAVAFAASGAFFYLMMAPAAWFLFSERLGLYQCIGLLMISIGVFFVLATKN